MREIRQSGSEGGGATALPTPIDLRWLEFSSGTVGARLAFHAAPTELGGRLGWSLL